MTQTHTINMIHKNSKSIPETDPSNLIRLRDSIYAPDLLVTAIGHLDFFTEINKFQLDFDGLCSHFKLDKRCADVMLTYFVHWDLFRLIMGFIL